MKLDHLPRFSKIRFLACLTTVLLLSACSMGQMVVRGTQSILDSGVESMNRESDLQLARDAMPANLKLIEGMLIEDPNNSEMRLFAAEGFYGYSYGFIEPEDTDRARLLYRRCYTHARKALRQSGVKTDPESSSSEELQAAVDHAGKSAVPALFWTASCLGKWIDLNRDKPTGIAGLSSAAIMMQRVIELENEFYFGGAHMFFGVYYGGRAPMFGGDFALSEKSFARATEINNDKLLLVDVLQAEYLDRQKLDQQSFHARLEKVMNAPDDLYPDMALINAISKQRAKRLLETEKDWF
ncbi:MAG: hypothetical protein KAJ06_08125 [Gammaproteobacteria bacterium]|nr:hypothetical protein [Gammaproteobacteria bacterium]